MDSDTDIIYISRFSSGLTAPIHTYDGLPTHLIESWDIQNRPKTVKKSVISGFTFNSCFYTREQAMEAVAALDRSVRAHHFNAFIRNVAKNQS